jgi:hypothetical protein
MPDLSTVQYSQTTMILHANSIVDNLKHIHNHDRMYRSILLHFVYVDVCRSFSQFVNEG